MTATKRKVKAMACNCLDKVQAKLATERPNVRLQTRMVVNFKTGKCRDVGPVLAVEKIDTKVRAKLPTILPTYCPFCGKKAT